MATPVPDSLSHPIPIPNYIVTIIVRLSLLFYCLVKVGHKQAALGNCLGSRGTRNMFGTYLELPTAILICCKKVTTSRNTKQLKMQQLLKYWDFVCGCDEINLRPVEKTSEVATPSRQITHHQLIVPPPVSQPPYTFDYPQKGVQRNHIQVFRDLWCCFGKLRTI